MELNDEFGGKKREVAQAREQVREMSYASVKELYNKELHVSINGISSRCHKNLNLAYILVAS